MSRIGRKPRRGETKNVTNTSFAESKKNARPSRISTPKGKNESEKIETTEKDESWTSNNVLRIGSKIDVKTKSLSNNHLKTRKS